MLRRLSDTKIVLLIISGCAMGYLIYGYFSSRNTGPAPKPGRNAVQSSHQEPPSPLNSPTEFLQPGLKLDAGELIWLSPPWQRKPSSSSRKIDVPKDFSTIQAAIDQAEDGAHILIAPGKYLENLDLKGKALVVSSHAGPLKTIVDGGGKLNVLKITQGEGRGTVITGLTLRNGRGAIDPAIDRKHIQGGGVYIRNASPILSWNIIERNRGENGGGILCADGCKALIANNLIRHNTAHKGGGIRISDASPVIINCVISDNHATRLGGGIYWRQASLPMIVNNTIYHNRAGEWGGGIYGSNNPPSNKWITLANNVIAANRAPRGSSLAFNMIPLEVRLVANLVQGGEEGIALQVPGIVVRWEPSNIALPENSLADPLHPPAGSLTADHGAQKWIDGISHDFLGNPRGLPAQKDGKEIVDIGAIERTSEQTPPPYWGLDE